jgi:hypothetical protein
METNTNQISNETEQMVDMLLEKFISLSKKELD